MAYIDPHDYLRRLAEDPSSITLDERIAYLEQCYHRDGLSRDSRRGLSRQIDALKKQRDAKDG